MSNEQQQEQSGEWRVAVMDAVRAYASANVSGNDDLAADLFQRIHSLLSAIPPSPESQAGVPPEESENIRNIQPLTYTASQSVAQEGEPFAWAYRYMTESGFSTGWVVTMDITTIEARRAECVNGDALKLEVLPLGVIK